MNLRSFTKKIILTAIVLIVFLGPVQSVKGVSVQDQISDGANDLVIAGTGGIFQTTPFINLKFLTVDSRAYFRFDNVSIPNGSSIQDATISLYSTWQTYPNGTVYSTINGLKDLDLEGSWNVENPAFIASIALTDQNQVVNISNLQGLQWRNYTVTNIVREMVAQYGWTNTTPLAFKFSTIAGVERSCYAYEGSPTLSAKLYVTYNNETPPSGLTFVQNYQNYTIYSEPTSSLDVSPLMYGGDGNWYTIKIDDPGAQDDRPVLNTNYSNPSGVTKLSGRQSIQVYGNTHYALFKNSTDAFEGIIYSTVNSGQNWTRVFNFSTTFQIQNGGFILDSSNASNPVFHIAYSDTNTKTNYQNYTVATSTNGADTELNDGFNENAYDPMIYLAPDDTLYVAYGCQNSASSARIGRISLRNSTTGVWSKKTLTNLGSFVTGDLGVDGYHDDTTGNDYVVFLWEHIGLGGPLTWFRSMVWGQQVGQPVGTIPKDSINWQQCTSLETIGGDDFVVDPDTGTLYIGSYTRVNSPNSIHSPSISSVLFDNASDPWNAGYTQQDGCNAPQATQWNKIYWSALGGSTSQDGINMIASNNNPEKYYIDSAWLNQAWGFGYNAYQYVDGVRTPTEWARVGIGDPNVQTWGINHDIARYYGTQLSALSYVVYFNGSQVNSSCISLAVTVEEVQACIDGIAGTQPSNPNPPGSNYPNEGIGTRFNVRFGMWLVAWVLIFAPLCAMAWKTFPFEYYLYFFIAMIFGFGLLLTIVNI